MNTALSEIQIQYKDCNLLIPSATSVQMNPFYKCTVMTVQADTSDKSGDIFKVGNTKVGEDRDGKPIYRDVYSLAKPMLMKMATAAGIQFHPEYTTVLRENSNTYVGRAYGAVRLPDGSYKTLADTKTICLDDEEDKYRLEFMDKSIKGIKDWKAAKAAEEMFKGHWEDTGETREYNGRSYPVKKYVIDDEDREKYIERSILVNMALLRKTASEKAQTGAILRVIRALLGIKGTYTKEELEKPFAVSTVTFAPDYNDPAVRNAMLQQGMNSMSNMFGTPSASVTASLPGNNPTDAFDAEAFSDNPAFKTDNSPNSEEGYDIPPEFGDDPDVQGSFQGLESEDGRNEIICSECGNPISQKVFDYSLKKYGRPLCYEHQKGAIG